jgi:hypothetical protein
MSALTPIRLAALLCLAIPAYAQSPSSPSPSQIPATPATAPQPQPAAPNRPQITYIDHKLTVHADNSSLNQILHEISQLTGITITGGVSEERVFGSYGPGSLSQVLNELLDGTSSNMLFVSSIGNKPGELILTPRTGGPTPPNPNAMRFNESADADNSPVNPPEPPDESSTQTPTSTAPAPAAAPQPAAQTNSGNGNNTTATPATSSDPNQQSPGGVKTPQQIFDQLMKLRQQQHPQPQ